jgi:GntR family transcriptional repressor for pyruvate dehydrogenase complex
MVKSDSPVLKKIKKETVTETIVNQIKDLIERNCFEVGQQLPSERELTAQLGVSRPSVREAMKALQLMGIVEIRSGSGTYLRERAHLLSDHFAIQNLLSKFTWLELTEARVVLESGLISIATEKAVEADMRALREACDNMYKNAADPVRFLEHDFAFHLTIAEASQNRFLVEMLSATRDLLLEVNQEVLKVAQQIDRAMESHEQILQAITDRDKNKARRAMSFHLKTVAKAIVTRFE